MHDRRKLPRRHLIYYLRVFDRQTKELLGHLVDISPEGVMLISEEPVEKNSEFELRMTLPVKVFGKQHLEFDARSLWCKKDDNPDFYAIGFQTSNISPEDIAIIERLVADYGFED